MLTVGHDTLTVDVVWTINTATVVYMLHEIGQHAITLTALYLLPRNTSSRWGRDV